MAGAPLQSHLDIVSITIKLAALPTAGFDLDFSRILIVDKRVADPGDGSQLQVGSYFTGTSLVEEITAVGSQTVVDALNISWQAGGSNLVVKKNGATQTVTTHYTVTDTNTITFVSGLTAGDVITLTVEQILGNGSKIKQFGESDALDGSVSYAVQKAIESTFRTQPHPQNIWVMAVDVDNVNTNGADAYHTIYPLIESAFPNYYGVVVISSTISAIADNVVGVTAAGVQGRHMVFGQSNSSVLTSVQSSGIKAAFLTTSAGGGGSAAQLTEGQRDRLSMHYHNRADSTPDVAAHAEYASQILCSNGDDHSPSGNVVLTATQALGRITSASIKTNLRNNNINFALPMPGTDTYVDPGLNLSGRAPYEILTADWVENRLTVALAALKVKYAKRNDKFPMDLAGQNLVLAILNKIFEMGVAAGHFLSPQDELIALNEKRIDALSERKAYTITSSDIAAQRLRFKFTAYFLVDARAFSLDIFLDR